MAYIVFRVLLNPLLVRLQGTTAAAAAAHLHLVTQSFMTHLLPARPYAAWRRTNTPAY